MVNLSQLREFMNRQSEKDRGNKTIEITGKSINEALLNASIELGIPVKDLEYEVIQKGQKAMFGVGDKEWKLFVYEGTELVAADSVVENLSVEDFGDITEKRDANGEVFVRLTHDGAYIKVTKAVGRGKMANEKNALDLVLKRGVTKYDSSMISKVVKRAENRWVKVGEFDYNPINDATMTVDIVDMEMKVYMEVSPPRLGGADLSKENIKKILENNGVYFGIKEDIVKEFEDRPQYSTSILIAEGQKPVNGNDAQIQYHFNTDHKNVSLKEEDGRVDFKELNLIENVVAGQVLAKKTLPEKGVNGKTVTGKNLPAKSGSDTVIQIGKNVKLSEDGTTAISEINGQVMLLSGRINVEPIYTVNGDVNLQTGNILFLGTVIIKGSVLDGFSVKAAGNIEVKGNVGKCILDAEGDVIVHQGILGKNGGKVRSGKSVFSKFIEHAKIEASEYVMVNEGILHSNVDANKKIICQGRRASIVGGNLRAAEEINAKNLGSIAGTETVLEVGYDPLSKEKLVNCEKNKMEIEKELEEIELNIKTLLNLKKVQRKLSEDKEANLQELTGKRDTCLAELEQVNVEMNEIREHLDALKKDGKISASEKVFPGVKLYIKDAFLEVKNEFKFVTFILEHNTIRITKYEAIEEEFKRRVV
ncbi:MAG: FapA family protein [Spirochaetales bacterium]|nr:FapA family protein [Spirochaetales bacterium]